MSQWRALDMEPADAAYNMAVDAVLARQQGSMSPPTLRLYRWSRPAVTLGYGLDAGQAVDLAGCARAGVEVTRRLTGGGVVMHDGAVTFTIAAPRQQADLPSASADLHTFAMALAREALCGLGVDARHADAPCAWVEGSANWCLARAYCGDLVADGCKVAGGADRRTEAATLYQGYVGAGRPSAATVAAAYPTGATPLPQVTGPSVDGDALLAGIARAFAGRVGRAEASALTHQEQEAAHEAASVFSRPAWVHGERAEIRRLRREVEAVRPS